MRSSSAIVGLSESIWIASVLVVIFVPHSVLVYFTALIVPSLPVTRQAFIKDLSRSIVHYFTSACILPRILHIILRSILPNILSRILSRILQNILQSILQSILHPIMVYTIHGLSRAFFKAFFTSFFLMGYGGPHPTPSTFDLDTTCEEAHSHFHVKIYTERKIHPVVVCSAG
jgi:hypothetical protein